jgi:hypothetical protein
MEILLEWNGPLIVGQRLPSSQKELDVLDASGVYLWYRKYPNGELVVNVGQTKDVARRLEEWLVQFLTLRCRVRRSDGTIFGDYSPLKFFNYLMNLDESLAVAKSEVQLTRFHYAFTTDIANAEASLIASLKGRAESTLDSDRPIVFGQNQPAFDRTTVLRHSFSRLVEPEAECGILAHILLG